MQTTQTTSRSCYICGSTDNPIIADERPVEHRFGRPLMPEGVYRFARCRQCSTLYVDSDVTDEYLSAIYENESLESVHELRKEIDHSKILNRRIPEFRYHWEQMKKLRRPKPQDKLLDVGCQTGDFGAVVQQDGVQPNGTELSESYASICKARWGNEAQVHLGSLSDAPFQNRQFQYVTAFETLEHMCDPIEELRRFRTWLADDGLLAISVPSSDYFNFKYWMLRKSPVASVVGKAFERRAAFYKHQVLPHTHIYNFSHKSIGLMLRRAGYQPIFLSVTGWHGPRGKVMRPVSRALEAVSQSRIGLAPSLFAIARPLPQ